MRHGPTLPLFFVLLFACAHPAAAGNHPLAPAYPEASIALDKAALDISFSPLHGQADWVFYELSPEHLQNCVQRSDSFRADPALGENSPTLADYKGSGYDRGHLSPAGDNRWSREAMHESFLLSNISPQPAAFNRGIWAKLENLVRAWGSEGEGLWVATGPVLKKGLPTIGDHEISVPEAFYKVLITKDERHAIALELPIDARGELSQFAVPVRTVESETGLNFFAGLDANEDRALKLDLDSRPWNFSARFAYEDCRTGAEDLAIDYPLSMRWFQPHQ